MNDIKVELDEEERIIKVVCGRCLKTATVDLELQKIILGSEIIKDAVDAIMQYHAHFCFREG